MGFDARWMVKTAAGWMPRPRITPDEMKERNHPTDKNQRKTQTLCAKSEQCFNAIVGCDGLREDFCNVFHPRDTEGKK